MNLLSENRVKKKKNSLKSNSVHNRWSFCDKNGIYTPEADINILFCLWIANNCV